MSDAENQTVDAYVASLRADHLRRYARDYIAYLEGRSLSQPCLRGQKRGGQGAQIKRFLESKIENRALF